MAELQAIFTVGTGEANGVPLSRRKQHDLRARRRPAPWRPPDRCPGADSRLQTRETRSSLAISQHVPARGAKAAFLSAAQRFVLQAC